MAVLTSLVIHQPVAPVMSPRRVPVSRRDRPAKPPLSRAGAVVVALQIMREEGLGPVPMRRLAAELGTGPASLYVYVTAAADCQNARARYELFSGTGGQRLSWMFDALIAGISTVPVPEPEPSAS